LDCELIMDLTKLENKLDKLDDRLDNVDKTLVAQHATLQEHIRRTAALESHLDVVKQELKPVQMHVTRVDGILKFIGLVSVVVGIVSTIIKFLGK
jgi:archaellum component FlaC